MTLYMERQGHGGYVYAMDKMTDYYLDYYLTVWYADTGETEQVHPAAMRVVDHE